MRAISHRLICDSVNVIVRSFSTTTYGFSRTVFLRQDIERKREIGDEEEDGKERKSRARSSPSVKK